MAWPEQLRAGSFRNCPFTVETADGDIGRRVALHEYPLRDKPFAEDLGRKARHFTLECFVVGRDYMRGRDQLIAALEMAGPGKLIHPYLGEMQVTVLSARGPRESTREGGMARFSIDFVESGDRVFPAADTDRSQVVQAKASLASLAAQREFSRRFSVTGRPAWLGSSACALIRSVTSQILAIKNSIPNLPATARQFSAELNSLDAAVESLIRTPAEIALALYDVVKGVSLLPDRPARAINAYRPLFAALINEPTVPETTASRRQQAANQQAVIAFTRRAAVIEASTCAASAEFASLNEAIAIRDELTELLDAQMLSADDGSYTALAALRAELVRYVAATSGDLARLVSYTPPVTVPALILAHQLYGDASRDGEIISRNRFRHPGFVPGGVAIEVQTDA